MGIAVKDSYDVTCDGRRVEYTHGIVVNLDLAKLYAIAPGRCTIHHRGGEVGDAISARASPENNIVVAARLTARADGRLIDTNTGEEVRP